MPASDDPLRTDQQFEVGEIVIVAVAIRNPAALGQERMIISQPRPLDWTNPATDKRVCAGSYLTQAPDGIFRQAYPWQLKRRNEPRDTSLPVFLEVEHGH